LGKQFCRELLFALNRPGAKTERDKLHAHIFHIIESGLIHLCQQMDRDAKNARRLIYLKIARFVHARFLRIERHFFIFHTGVQYHHFPSLANASEFLRYLALCGFPLIFSKFIRIYKRPRRTCPVGKKVISVLLSRYACPDAVAVRPCHIFATNPVERQPLYMQHIFPPHDLFDKSISDLSLNDIIILPTVALVNRYIFGVYQIKMIRTAYAVAMYFRIRITKTSLRKKRIAESIGSMKGGRLYFS